MSIPFMVKNIVDEVIKLLDPNLNYLRIIEPYHNGLIVKGVNFTIGKKIHLFAVGKAASFELLALKKVLTKLNLKDKIGMCVSYTKIDHLVEDESILQLEGSHPLVTEDNINKTKLFIQKLQAISPEDSLIFLLSGGASALLEYPKDGMSFAELQDMHSALLNSGLNINEMNRRRKVVSQVKDGGLLNFIPTDQIIQLITCDIPNENLCDVGSGPLLNKDDMSKHPVTFMVQSASTLLSDLCRETKNRHQGKIFDCLLSQMEEELLKNLPEKGQFHFSGGEATINLPANARKGGRNTHFVLSFAHKIYQLPENRDIQIMSMGTDGSDGPTDAAGAYINFDIYSQLNAQEYLKEYNSYEFFNKLGTLIRTGPTKTNVMDVRMIWRE